MGAEWVKRRLVLTLACSVALGSCGAQPAEPPAEIAPVIVNQGNPLFRDLYTADPAPLVVGDTLYIYVGQTNPAATRCSTSPNGSPIQPKTCRTGRRTGRS